MPPKKQKQSSPPSAVSEVGPSSNKRSTKTSRELLFAYIKSSKAGLFVQTFEETRAESEIAGIAKELGFALYSWSLTQGLVCVSETPARSISDTESPLAMLDSFMKLPARTIVIARDMHMLLGSAHNPDPMIIRKIKDAIKVGTVTNRSLITTGCRFISIPELEKEWAVVEFKLPDKAQLMVVLENISKDAGLELNGNTEAILDAASGLTTQEASDAFAMSIVETGLILPEIVAREKAQTVKKNGILEILETTENADSIGGLEIIKDWVKRRRMAFTKKAKEFGLPVPKGVLAVGIPGCGKSLLGKATASILGVPLLKLDAGKVFAGLVGQSEENLRTVIQTAEAVAPCVLFVDELEKGFSGSKSSGSTDGGTSARVFGTFLQWMNDKTSPVFVFATANDITQLPPEFLRKGRFDELFYVDLPDLEEREEIWKVHLRKRGRNPDDFGITALSKETNQFTGAEIEAAVNEGLFSAFDEATDDVKDRHLMEAVKNTVPLSRTMATQIDQLRTWANGRARKASIVKDTTAQQTRKIA